MDAINQGPTIMTRKRRKTDQRIAGEQVDERLEERRRTAAMDPNGIKPKRFVSRPCCMCSAFRPPATNYSFVYAKHGRVRYCKCRFCGNTWTQVISGDQ